MTALGRVQQRGHGDIDAVYAPLADAVELAVLRRMTPSMPSNDSGPSVAPLILADIGRLLDATRPLVLAVLVPRLRDAAVAAQPDDAPLGALATSTLVSPAARRAAVALHTDRASVLRQTGALVVGGIRRGIAATAIAKQVKQYFNPFFAPRRDAAGQLRRDGRIGAVLSWPGQAGMASQHPRLVMLTETSDVYNETMRAVASRDGELLRWTLSIQHRDRDLCDENAMVNVGYGPGVYPADAAPPVPTHPRCRCYYEPAGKSPTFPEEQFAITGKRRGFPQRWRA